MMFTYPIAHLGGAGVIPSTLLDGLLSWFELNEESGVRADSHGSISLTDNNTTGFAAGKQGNASLHVEANNEYLSNSDTGYDHSIPIASGSYWSRYSSLPNTAPRAWSARRGSEGTEVYVLASDSKQYLVWSGASTLAGDLRTINTWEFTYWYVDTTNDNGGIQLNNNAIIENIGGFVDPSPPLDQILRIGQTAGTTANRGWNGEIDLVNMYNRVLTSDEVTALYNGGAGLAYPG